MLQQAREKIKYILQKKKKPVTNVVAANVSYIL